MGKAGEKSLLLGMYGVALFFVLKRYYANGNSGLPNPAAVAGPTYLYGILALTSGFLGGLPIWIGAGMTIALIWQSQKTPVQPATKPSTPQSQVANQNSKNTTAYPGPTSAVGSSRKTG